MYDLAVFIGRFSPFHNGHEKIVREGLAIAKRVLILVGSSYRPRTSRNPFTFQERAGMIGLCFNNEDLQRISIRPLEDILYNDQLWIGQVQDRVREELGEYGDTNSVTLIGHKKDATSYYIDMFPQWASTPVEPEINHNTKGELDATYIRELMFTGIGMISNSYTDDFGYYSQSVLNRNVAEYLRTIDISEAKAEYEHVKKYKKAWEQTPYPPIHHTVDAVVVQSGHVLMVERGAQPGKGLLALPGGFLNEDERMLDGAIRELREETKIKVPGPVLRGNIKRRETFDEPKRSSRGRTITDAFLIELPNGPLPKVKGSDDAAKAFWYPIAKLNSEDLFEDHYDILQVMLGERTKLN